MFSLVRRLKIGQSFTLAYLLLLLPARVISQVASFDGLVLDLPYVESDGSIYATQLGFVEDSGLAEFLLQSIEEVAASNNQLHAKFSDGVLAIPQLEYLGNQYWVEMALLADSNPPRFRLSSAFTLNADTTSEEVGSQYLIQNINVIDVAAEALLPAYSVLIADNRIQSVRPGELLPVPANFPVVDGSDKYLIPGLWDTHVHVNSEEELALFIIKGVTGIRQMYGAPDLREYDWRAQIGTPDFVSPRLLVGSTTLGGAGGSPGHIAVTDEESGREQVRYFHEVGADFIKVYDGLTRDVYLAILDEASKLGLPVAGHAPDAVSVSEISSLGQISIEHANGLNAETAIDYADIILEMTARASSENREVSWNDRLLAQERTYNEQDPAKQAALDQLLRDNGTFVVPTFVVSQTWSMLTNDAEENASLHEEFIDYVSPSTLAGWTADPVVQSAPVAFRIFEVLLYSNRLQLIKRLHDAGVPIATGTDAGVAYVFYGFSMHDELQSMVDSGISEIQSLKAATINAAELVGMTDQLGTIDRGKLADLVILNANPLDDIANTEAIDAVIFNGQYRSREVLDDLLEELK